MLLDTGAEVTIFSTNFLHRLFPGQEFPDRGRSVRSVGGNHIAVKGPVMLTIEICCQVLQHPVFCDGATTPLLGYDGVSAACLVIDTEARQVWSKHTVQYGHTEPFTPPTTEPSTATNLATVRRSSITVLTTVTDLSTCLRRLNYSLNYRSLNRHQHVIPLLFVNSDYRRPVYYYSIHYCFNYPRHHYYAVGDRSFAVVRVIEALSLLPRWLYFIIDFYRPR